MASTKFTLDATIKIRGKLSNTKGENSSRQLKNWTDYLTGWHLALDILLPNVVRSLIKKQINKNKANKKPHKILTSRSVYDTDQSVSCLAASRLEWPSRTGPEGHTWATARGPHAAEPSGGEGPSLVPPAAQRSSPGSSSRRGSCTNRCQSCGSGCIWSDCNKSSISPWPRQNWGKIVKTDLRTSQMFCKFCTMKERESKLRALCRERL